MDYQYNVGSEKSITRHSFEELRDQRDEALDKLLLAYARIDILLNLLGKYTQVLDFALLYHGFEGDQVRKRILELKEEMRS